MNGKSIPGFYWDPEKKKYFQIQANHVAPAGSQYSKEAVKKRKLNNEQNKRQIAISRRVRRERVQTQRWLNHSFSRLTTEVGNKNIPGYVKKSQLGGNYVSQLQGRNLCNFNSNSVADFARHGPSGVFVAGVNSGLNTEIFVCPPSSKDAEDWNYNMKHNAAHLGIDYRLSSISMCESGYFLVTLDSSSRGDSAVGVGFLDHLNVYTTNAQSWSGRRIPMKLLRQDEVTFWCSAARPNSCSNPAFAIGASNGLNNLNTLSDGILRTDLVLDRSSDVLAVEWLSENVIASGFRDSFLFLSDLRSGGSSQRIKHPHSIGQIKKLDDHRLIVAGYKSLYTYDLRYPKTEAVFKPPTKNPRNRHNAKSSTKPYLVFDDYSCELGHQIDISHELGILASVTHDQKLRFYSLADGSVIPTPASLLRNSPACNENITRMRFEEYQYPMHQRQTPRLLYSQRSIVREVAW